MNLPILINEPLSIEQRLAELGVRKDALDRAVRASFAAWAACTPHHPPSAPGLSSWFEGVATLRYELVPDGWQCMNDQNLPLTANADGSIAIAYSSGDAATGTVENPSTKSDKGPRTIHAVASNRDQLCLFPDEELPLPGDTSDRQTWILLVYRDEIRREVRCELSRPIGLDSDNRVNDWHERIILDAFPYDGDEMDFGKITPPVGPSFSVDIKKRA